MNDNTIFGQTSQELMQRLLDEALAEGTIEIVGEDENGKTLFRGTGHAPA